MGDASAPSGMRVINSDRLEGRPAAVLFIAAGPVLARVVQQPLPDLLPNGLLPVQANGIGLLDLDNALASAAGNAQDVLRELGQAEPCTPSH
ncbi:hypothetical protein [Bradyrhizobium sacchari]|uniref:hypothetical protein n=1 Tax=Bradyrhizobium sacchari TaxID=1399419 RepID=UPI00142EDB71